MVGIYNKLLIQRGKAAFSIFAKVLDYIQNVLFFGIVFDLRKGIAQLIEMLEKDIGTKLFIFSSICFDHFKHYLVCI